MMEVTAPAFCHLSVSLGVLFIRLPFLLLHLSGSVSSSHVMNDGAPHETQPSWWSLRGLVPLIWTPTSSPFHPFIKQLCTNPEFLWNSQLLEMIETQGGIPCFPLSCWLHCFSGFSAPPPNFITKMQQTEQLHIRTHAFRFLFMSGLKMLHLKVLKCREHTKRKPFLTSSPRGDFNLKWVGTCKFSLSCTDMIS